MASSTVEDYLKQIYAMQSDVGPAELVSMGDALRASMCASYG